MSNKYHVNPATNRPNICRAKDDSCPFKHFTNKEQAKSYIEQELSEQSTILNSSQKTLSPPESQDNNAEIEPMKETVQVITSDISNVQNYIDKLNNKIQRAGGEEFFELELGEETYIKKDDKYITVRDATLTTPRITVGDYEFKATVDIVDGGTILRSPIGQQLDGLERPTNHVCDHCGTNRDRKHTYLLQDKKTGEIKQVGKSCMQAFTGIEPSLWAFDANFDRFSYKNTATSKHAEYMHNPDDIIAISYIITNNGQDYVSVNRSIISGETPTSHRVQTILNYLKHPGRTAIAPHEKECERIFRLAGTVDQSIIDQIKQSAQQTSGDYGENLKVAMSSKMITEKHIGIAASAISAHKRQQAHNAKIKKEKENPRHTLEEVKTLYPEKTKVASKPVRIVNTNSYISFNNKKVNLITFEDSNGDVFTWHSTAKGSDKLKIGDDVNLSATVKTHNKWKDQPQTVITRAKLEKIVKSEE